MKKYIPSLASLLLILFFIAVPSHAQRGQIARLRQESAALERQLKETERLINTTRRDVATQMSNLNILNEQISKQQRHIRNIEAERDTLETAVQNLSLQLSALETDLANCRRRHQRVVMYMHRNRSLTSFWSFILTAKDFRQMYRRMRYLSEYGKFQRMQAAAIREKEEAVMQKRTELSAVAAEKAEVLSESQRQHEQLRVRESQQQQLVAQLGKRQKELERTAAATRQRRQQLDGRIAQLVQQEAEAERKRQLEAERKRKAEAAAAERRRQEEAARKRRQQEAAAQQQANNRKKDKKDKKQTRQERREERHQERAAQTTTTTTPVAPSRSYGGGLHGGLPMPITGSYAITTHFGNYSSGGVTLNNKGIDITGHSGAQARAVANGEVSYIFSMNGYQNVIVRHGSYMTVYCNLSSVSVRKGQKVSARQTLGSVGRDASGNCTLHFQIWKERTILNPESWLAR